MSRHRRAMAVHRRDRSALTLLSNDLDRAVCLDPSALSPPLAARPSAAVPPTSPRRLSVNGTPSERCRASPDASTRLPTALFDSDRDHRPFPDANNAGGMWRQCGAPTSGKPRWDGGPGPFSQREVAGKFAPSAVDKAKSRRLYSRHNGAPPALRRDDAPAKLLTDCVTSRPTSVGSLGLRRLSGSSERGDRTVPGLFDN